LASDRPAGTERRAARARSGSVRGGVGRRLPPRGRGDHRRRRYGRGHGRRRCRRAAPGGGRVGPEASVSGFRPTRATVDLEAIGHNVRALKPAGVELMAVVKANGYGHGDVPVARAAVDAGATWLGVALVEEGLALRLAGIETPILVLSEVPPGSEAVALAHRLTPTLATPEGLGRLATAARG